MAARRKNGVLDFLTKKKVTYRRHVGKERAALASPGAETGSGGTQGDGTRGTEAQGGTEKV